MIKETDPRMPTMLREAEAFLCFPNTMCTEEQKVRAVDVARFGLQILDITRAHLLKGKWVPITREEDLKQPPGLYWTTYLSEGGEHVGSDRLYPNGEEQFTANTVAYMRIEEPEPWEDE